MSQMQVIGRAIAKERDREFLDDETVEHEQ
jgi:hypothetical protein